MMRSRFYGLVALAALSATLGDASGGNKLTLGQSSTQRPGVIRTWSPLWKIGDGYSSTLILRNTDSQNTVTAKVTLFSLEGEQVKTVNLDLPANAVRRVAIADAVANSGQSDSTQSGSLSVEYATHGKPVLIGQVVIENEKEGLIFDLRLQSGYTFDSERALFASWWLSDESTDGTVVLCNSTGGNIVVSLFLSTDNGELPVKDVALAPHETKKLSLREMLAVVGLVNVSQGALTLRYTGGLRSLQPALLLANTKTGFSLLSAFNAKHAQPSAQQPPPATAWRFPDVILSPDATLGFDMKNPVTAYALLSNGTNSQISTQLEAVVDKSDETGAGQPVEPVSLPIDPLQPQETRLVDLSALARTNHISDTVSHFALTAIHDGVPGDLAITVFSVGENQNFVFRAEGSVSAAPVVYSSYWDVGDELTALLAVQNASEDPVEAEATLYYQTNHGQGTYSLPPLELQGNGARLLNLKEAIVNDVPDKDGNVIPKNVTFGTLTLKTARTRHGAILGGSTSFDALRGGYGAPIGGGTPDACCIDEFDCNLEGFTDPSEDPSCDAPPPGEPPGPGGATSPTLNAVSPSEGLIGNAVSISLAGVGFGTSPSLVLPSGITASIQSSSDTQISATLMISTSISGGNEAIQVKNSETALSSNTLNFFVQIPKTLVRSTDFGTNGLGPVNVITDSSVIDIDGHTLATHQCGVYENIGYQLVDQRTPAQPIFGNYTIHETFSNYSTTVSGLTVPPPKDNPIVISQLIIGDTQFFGKAAPSCPGSNDHEQFDQVQSVIIGTAPPYPLSIVNTIQRGSFSGTEKIVVTIKTP